MTRILLVGNYRPDRQHSMLRYCVWLASILTGRGFQVDVLEPAAHFGRWVAPTHPVHKWLGYLDKFLLFPFNLYRQAGRYDVVHICDQSNAVYRRFARRTPVTLTCHDLIAIRTMLGEFERQQLRWSGRVLQTWILSSLKTIKRVACVSASTAEDLERVAPCPERHCDVIENPVIGFSPMASDEAERALAGAGIGPAIPFFLCVGSNLWYKNRIGILRLFAEALKQPGLEDMYLVCAGAELSPELRSMATALGILPRIKEIVSPSSGLLRALYSKATALLFTSLVEGFGWPIIEAQACGCPVITSDREPMKSIGGKEAALFVDPDRPAEAAKTIGERWQWLSSRKDASLGNAARFSQQKAADEYFAFFTAAAGQRTPRP
jgi:glycosyltransferase involved in cell wall biosynthesis